jgi:hypothetical protein
VHNVRNYKSKIAIALNKLAPNSEWVLLGNNYDEIEWLSQDNKPTWAQVQAEINNPTPTPEPTVEHKLASVGLNLTDLKTALGL